MTALLVLAVALLVLVALAVAVPAIRGWVLRTARAGSRRLPPRARNRVRDVADERFPSWRARIGEPRRGLLALEWRLHHTARLTGPRVYILGPTYLDIFMASIDTDRLEPTEHSGFDPVRLDCGGSAVHFGRFLHDYHQESSVLFSRVSTRDELGKELRTLLAGEKWMSRKPRLTRVAEAQGAISVHVMQRNRGFYTTLTHRGAASTLTWQPQLDRVRKEAARGGLLYLTGYFRTNLKEELSRSLRALPPHVVVMLDHGRFRREEHSEAVPALLEAFRQGLVDVYNSTLEEMASITEVQGIAFDRDSPLPSLRAIAAARILPRVTALRYKIDNNTASAITIVDGQVDVVTKAASELRTVRRGRVVLIPNQRPGTRNAFVAGMAHRFLAAGPDVALVDTTRDAVAQGLEDWIRAAS